MLGIRATALAAIATFSIIGCVVPSFPPPHPAIASSPTPSVPTDIWSLLREGTGYVAQHEVLTEKLILLERSHHNFIDIDIGRLLDRKGNCPSDRIGWNHCLPEPLYPLRCFGIGDGIGKLRFSHSR
jgi:hypothetical protein